MRPNQQIVHACLPLELVSGGSVRFPLPCFGVCPLIQNDYRQEKNIFELFSGALQENPVRAPGAITRAGSHRTGAHTGDYFGGILFRNFSGISSGIVPGQLHEKCMAELCCPITFAVVRNQFFCRVGLSSGQQILVSM